MKFEKEFASQMVPEWQEAYMDYNYLKTLLKELQRFKQRAKPPATPGGGLKRKLTLYRAFSGLRQRHRNPTSPSPSPDIESQSILVNFVNRNDYQSYETTFQMSSDEGGEYEPVYFRRLDDEFNKVEKFYRDKVENPPGVNFDRSAEMTRLASDIAASAAALSAATPSGARSASKKLSTWKPLKRAPMDKLMTTMMMKKREMLRFKKQNQRNPNQGHRTCTT
ncbi:hypothetical protein DITRI_Ditri17bG0122300 [Diplodiscus trichospermus]